ncbi:MAG: hypothetical protein IJ870_03000 [Alphaproteobacteria bacterium]|nr:hypothetical protein [Alphaproteobacteria bacterium]
MTTGYKLIFGALLEVLLCAGFYFLGRAHSEVKILHEKGEEIIKEVEVIKYVNKEKAEIWSEPNASHAELIGLFMQNKL